VQEFLSSAAPQQIDANSFVDEKLKQQFLLNTILLCLQVQP